MSCNLEIHIFLICSVTGLKDKNIYFSVLLISRIYAIIICGFAVITWEYICAAMQKYKICQLTQRVL